MTRKPDKGRTPNIIRGVFHIPFLHPGRFVGMLIAMAKHHRSRATTRVLDPLPKKGKPLLFVCLFITQGVTHPFSPTVPLPFQELLPCRTGLSGCRAPACGVGCLCLGICHSGLRWQRYRNPACWFVARYGEGKLLTPALVSAARDRGTFACDFLLARHSE